MVIWMGSSTIDWIREYCGCEL